MSQQQGEVTACIGMGSNLGDRGGTLALAADRLAGLPRTTLVALATPIETEAVAPSDAGVDPGGPYLNAAAVLRTALPARELLDAMLAIERDLGRDRSAGAPRWGPRTIDLDLLLYGESVIDEPGLVVPHPRMRDRAFVLVPLAQVAPDVRVPPRGERVADLLAALRARTVAGAGHVL